jgi:uncharacterized membrane protein YvlD (DUF360 family)
MAATFVPGFHIRSFGAALCGAAVLAILQMIFRFLLNDDRDTQRAL